MHKKKQCNYGHEQGLVFYFIFINCLYKHFISLSMHLFSIHIPGNSGNTAGDTLNRVPTCHRAQSHTLIHTDVADNFKMPVRMSTMLGLGEKTQIPEGNLLKQKGKF